MWSVYLLLQSFRRFNWLLSCHNSTFLGNDPKTTLVLNFYAFSCRKNTCSTPTMMATSEAGHSLLPIYIGPKLTSTPKDDNVWVLQAPCPCSDKISTLTWHGTYHAIATHVERFPFLPLNNHHEPHCSMTSAPAPSTSLTTSCCISPFEDAKPSCQSFELDDPFCPINCKCPFAFCRGTCSTGSMTTTPAPLLCSPNPCSISPADATPEQPPKREPIDHAAIQQQICNSMTMLDWLFSMPMPMMMMTQPP